MFLMRLIPLFVLLLFTVACSRNNAVNKGNGTQINTDPSAYDSKPNELSPPDTFFIEGTPNLQEPNKDFETADAWMTPTEGSYLVVKIKRTGCYGTCPIYVGAIFSDGKAFYHGERFVESIGYFEGAVSDEQLKTLVKASYENHFYTLAPEYPIDGRFISDLPAKKLYFNSGIDKKTILDRGNAPAELDVIEETVQNLLHSIEWKLIKN